MALTSSTGRTCTLEVLTGTATDGVHHTWSMKVSVFAGQMFVVKARLNSPAVHSCHRSNNPTPVHALIRKKL